MQRGANVSPLRCRIKIHCELSILSYSTVFLGKVISENVRMRRFEKPLFDFRFSYCFITTTS